MRYIGFTTIKKEVNQIQRTLGIRETDWLAWIVYCFLLLILVSGVVFWSISGFRTAFPKDTPNTPTTDNSIRQTANNNTAPVSQSVNVNQESRYTWANAKNWTARAQDNGSGQYQVNLVFVADGPVIPVSPCLYISSNAEVISSGPIGYSLTWAEKTTPETHTQCFGGLGNTVTFQVFFKEKPLDLEAKLVQDKDKPKDTKIEPSFAIPVQ